MTLVFFFYLSFVVFNCFTFVMFSDVLVITLKVGNLASKRGQQTGMGTGTNLKMKVCCKIIIFNSKDGNFL